MIQLPHNCRYYLDQCRDYAFKGDYVHALRMLYLAQTYADNSDDEYECYAEKLNIFDALGMDTEAVCYESIAKQAFGEEMYAVLVNKALARKDMELAAYYLELYNDEQDGDLPEITPSDSADGDKITLPVEKLLEEASAVERAGRIRPVNGEEELINAELKRVLEAAAMGKLTAGHVQGLMDIVTDNKEMNERICRVLSQCAEVIKKEAALEIYRHLSGRVRDIPLVICDACINPVVREDRQLWEKYDKMLMEFTSAGVSKENAALKRMAALALVEHGHANEALEVLKECDTSLADIFARRVYISALLMTANGEEEALSLLEDSLLLQEEDDRIVWEFYRKYGKDRCFEHYNCPFFSVKESVMNDAANMTPEEAEEMMGTVYGRYMFEDLAHCASYRNTPLSDETMVEFICLYTDNHPQAALELLYNHNISSRIKRTILHRFIYYFDVYDVKKHVFMTSVDRMITVEDYGYVYRNDLIFGEEFDEWNDRIRAAMCTAAVDCCFYNNYEEGEIYEAMKKVYDTMREKHILAAFKTIYRAVVLALNPHLEDFYNITGMTEADKDKVLAVARKFDLGVIVTAPGSDQF